MALVAVAPVSGHREEGAQTSAFKNGHHSVDKESKCTLYL